jgi:aryl-alcohol dehydrogenase-like predicted oxidoreductase
LKLALGTVQFGLSYGIANQAGQVSRAETKEMLEFAVSQGIDTIDTAIAYGDSEACLGEIGVQDLKIVTKLPPIPDVCDDINQWVSQHISDSIRRIGCRELHGLMLHQSTDLLGKFGQQLYNAMQNLKDNGLVRKIGVSIYSPVELDAISTKFAVDIVQAPFNVVDQRLLTTGWLYRLENDGIELHTRSSFLQGLLLMPREAIPEKFSRWAPLWDSWNRWLHDRGVPAAKVCLDFVRSFNQIDRVVVGVDNLAQLKELAVFASAPPTLEFPSIICSDEELINPANWPSLGRRNKL